MVAVRIAVRRQCALLVMLAMTAPSYHVVVANPAASASGSSAQQTTNVDLLMPSVQPQVVRPSVFRYYHRNFSFCKPNNRASFRRNTRSSLSQSVTLSDSTPNSFVTLQTTTHPYLLEHYTNA